jgi:peroxiredoxin
MALTPSTMLPLGTKAPDFNLPDTVSNNELSLDDIKSDVATVIMFICNHCPYVKHIQSELSRIATDYAAKNINFAAISANDAENYPADSPEKMKEFAQQNHFSFPYLYDESQETAKSYQAACTPDFYVFDNNLKCVYRGRFDDSSPGKDAPVTGKDLRNALDNLIGGKTINPDQIPSIGCNIKWK